MKKRIYILSFLVLGLITGCSDFLKETDKDKVVPRTVEHYRAMLNAEAYSQLVDYFHTDLMTDDVREYANATAENKNKWKSLYTWQRDLEMNGNNKVDAALNYSWIRNYKLIAILNYVFEQIDEATGDEAEKMHLKGEAHCLRAKSYLELVNLYAKHYNPATASQDLGVPIRLDVGVEDYYSRKSVQEVYDVIESELITGIQLMTDSKIRRNVWSMSPLAGKLLLSRVYLYKGEFQKCADISTEIIDATGGMLWNLSQNTSMPYVNFANPEILFTWCNPGYCRSSDGQTKSYVDGTPLFQASTELYSLFLTGDARKTYYINYSQSAYLPVKMTDKCTGLGAFSYRSIEAFLNRAEANFELGHADLAKADITTVVSNRVSDISKITVPDEGEALKTFIYNERRREFCFEGMRWIDLKRWKDRRTQISHSYTMRSTDGATLGTEQYILLENDPNYILPIPNDEIDGNNELLIQNDRYEKRPIKN